ncbi:MAG: hypothetical protein ABSB70_14670 [Candidatus Velthaea sp.]|jgi:hypothetical protein
MSFLNNIGGLLSQFTSAPPSQVQSAAADHIGGMDADQLAGHLSDSAQNLNAGQLGQLATSILGALTSQGQNAAAVANNAGVSTADAQAGDQDAVTALISHAQQNPAALKDAAIDFIKNNPQAVQQFAPDFLKGILSKFAG